ncbi:MAG: zinc-ribbon domain-containing protein [Lachnospiraceae bacterium]|nr:zinc-ribbon domain-containing protein [Lachnospiraceae bacterium]
MFCPNCGTELANGAAFCPKCGTPLQQMATAQFNYGNGQTEEPKEQSTLSAVGHTIGYMGKLAFLCAIAAIAICAVIGLIVWKVEYSDGPKPFNGAKIKAQTIWQENGLSVDATKLVDPDIDRDALVLKVKNETGRDLNIKAVSLAVNGTSVPAYLEQTAPNGKTQEMKLEMDDYLADYLGVDTPSVLSLELQALDPSSGEEVFRSDIIIVNTSITDPPQKPSYTGYFSKFSELFDIGGLKIGSFGYLADPIGPGFTVDNPTGSSVRVEFTVTEISGREVKPRDNYYRKSAVIQAGTIGACFVHSNFEELKMMDGDGNGDVFPVTQMVGSIAVYDAYDGTLIKEQTFTYDEAQ